MPAKKGQKSTGVYRSSFTTGQVEPAALARGADWQNETTNLYQEALLESRNVEHRLRGGVRKRRCFANLYEFTEGFSDSLIKLWPISESEQYMLVLRRRVNSSDLEFLFLGIEESEDNLSLYVAHHDTYPGPNETAINLGNSKLDEIDIAFYAEFATLCHQKFSPIIIESPARDVFNLGPIITRNGPFVYLGENAIYNADDYGGTNFVRNHNVPEVAGKTPREFVPTIYMDGTQGIDIARTGADGTVLFQLQTESRKDGLPKLGPADIPLPNGVYAAMWNPIFGYPSCATIQFNRLVLGGSPRYHKHLWWSAFGEWQNFAEYYRNPSIAESDGSPGSTKATYAFIDVVDADATGA